ncbi:hypothetical protein BLA29_000387 [Euroglyphus maynei]|uniref:histone acetyltransferase n=1 Tax=Euroglyphus maynei TaxID=6958 RepID=A0A1Y3BEX8_EURMA|nr:hypothetical protein BLA29_000387 [Euroglyphus maynei]
MFYLFFPKGDDYIFHCHPPEQKIPKPKRLQEWYKKMLDKGIIERIVLDYKDILKQATEDNLKNASELPYFEGDFWPNVLEDSIKEIEMEHQKQQQLMDSNKSDPSGNDKTMDDDSIVEMIDSVEQKDGDGKMSKESDNSKQHKKNSANKKSNKKQNNRKNNVLSRLKSGPMANQPQTQLSPIQQFDAELTSKIFATMEKHKEVFFVVRLHSTQSAASLPPVNDPDNLINCDLMDGRDAFLTLARDKHYEFSSLRRAKFSSLAMLYELHNCNNERFLYTCNNCKRSLVETRYHCSHCDDFDLCVLCYEKDGHQHRMDKIEFGDLMSSVDGDVSNAANALNSNAGGDGDGNNDPSVPGSNVGTSQSETRRQSIQRCIESLSHACQCRDANCRRPTCLKMKRVVQHAKSCKRKNVANHCQICKQLIALCCYHAKHCQEPGNKCLVPYCQNFKQKIQQQQIQQRYQQAQILKRRIASMSMAIHQSSQNSQSTSSNNSTTSCPPQPCHMKPATTPPAGALQAAAAVQAVARQQQNTQNMQPMIGKGGKPMLPYMSSTSQISKPQSMTSNQSVTMQPKMGPQSDMQQQSSQQTPQQWFSSQSHQARFNRPQMQSQTQFSQSQMMNMQQQQNIGSNLPSLLMSNQNIQQQHPQQIGLNHQQTQQQQQQQQMTNPNMPQQMSNQPNQNNYAQLIKTFKNSTTSTNPDVMSFIKNDPKMMAALIRTQQHPSQQQQQQMSMQQNVPMINQQGSNLSSQLSQNQNWYGPSPAQSQRMMNPGQRQLNPQTSPRASMMMNTVQNQAPSQALQQQQQVYSNQQQQIRFNTTNWSGNSQQQNSQQQQQRLPMLRGNPGQMNQMNTVRLINAQNTTGVMMNSLNDATQEMFYQQSDYVPMSMNQQPELTPQEKISKFVEES